MKITVCKELYLAKCFILESANISIDKIKETITVKSNPSGTYLCFPQYRIHNLPDLKNLAVASNHL